MIEKKQALKIVIIYFTQVNIDKNLLIPDRLF